MGHAACLVSRSPEIFKECFIRKSMNLLNFFNLDNNEPSPDLCKLYQNKALPFLGHTPIPRYGNTVAPPASTSIHLELKIEFNHYIDHIKYRCSNIYLLNRLAKLLSDYQYLNF
jgi:hypothetical protein